MTWRSPEAVFQNRQRLKGVYHLLKYFQGSDMKSQGFIATFQIFEAIPLSWYKSE